MCPKNSPKRLSFQIGEFRINLINFFLVSFSLVNYSVFGIDFAKMCGFENSFSEKRFVFSSKNGHRVNDEDLMQIYMKQIAHRDIFYGSVCVA